MSESIIHLPSTPLLGQGFSRCVENSISEAHVKRYVRRMDMKKDEFDEEMCRSQMVFVDKHTNEIFLITPSYIQ